MVGTHSKKKKINISLYVRRLKRLKFIYYDRDVIYAFRCAQYILHNVVAELVYILIRFLATQELK